MARRLITVAAVGVLLLAGLVAALPARFVDAGELLYRIAIGPTPANAVERRLAIYRVAGSERRADVYVPAAETARASVVLVPGVARRGWRDPRLVAFAEQLAMARFAVFVPDIENLRRLKVAVTDAAAIADALAHAAASDHAAGKAGLIAISYAAGPAILAAMRPDVRDRVAFLVAIGGYHDAEAVVTFFTTGAYRSSDDARWRTGTPNPYGKWVFVHSNAARLADPRDRALLTAMAARKLRDPDAAVDDLAGRLGAGGRSVYRLVTNDDPARVPELIADLPASVRHELRALDLSRRDLSTLRARVYLVHGRDDPVIPFTESMALKRALPPDQAEIYIVDQLMHVELGPLGIGDGYRLFALVASVLAERDRLHRQHTQGSVMWFQAPERLQAWGSWPAYRRP
jgi:pimeloyl-ACP methyl ester carboxylesterase